MVGWNHQPVPFPSVPTERAPSAHLPGRKRHQGQRTRPICNILHWRFFTSDHALQKNIPISIYIWYIYIYIHHISYISIHPSISICQLSKHVQHVQDAEDHHLRDRLPAESASVKRLKDMVFLKALRTCGQTGGPNETMGNPWENGENHGKS